MIQVAEGILLHLDIFRFPESGSEAVGGSCGKSGIDKARNQGQQSAAHHNHAPLYNVVHIVVCHPHVNHVSHQHGDRKLKTGLYHHKQHSQNKLLPVWLHVSENSL